jgi:exodeoxyribonuclease V alpha subunit
MPETLSGVVDRVTFHNQDTGYCVLRVTARGHRDPVAVVGTLARVVAGEFVEAAGDWVVDKQYGQQFKAAELRTTPPHTAEGIVRYLGSGFVKGIGPTYAKKIVAKFGDKTLDVIDQDPAFLNQVKGIGPKRLALIRSGWAEAKAVRAILVFLQSFGIGPQRAQRIYKTYGDTAVDLVRQNPYRLSADIWGVGFKTADDVALRIGIPRDSPHRAKAAVRHVLSEAAGTAGHVGLPEEVLIHETGALTEIPPEGLTAAINELIVEGDVVRDGPNAERGIRNAESKSLSSDDPNSEFRIPNSELVYLKHLHAAEVGVARSIHRLKTGSHPIPSIDTAKAVAWAEKKMGIEFAPSQRDAIAAAGTEKLLVVTGGPGTGKTTIVRAILDIYAAKQQRVLLGAPTGRAAKRLAESTGRDAKTIHRLLEFDAAIGTFRRSGDHHLDADLVVVDEVSMVDVVLMNQLLRAVPPSACVVLVGDVDQLPSVGAGSVLADVIASGAVRVARLTEVHRQARESYIIQAAHAVNRGEEPESAPAGRGDFYHVEADDPPTILDRILFMVKERIPAKFDLDPARDVQVLSPMNKSELGVNNLNAKLQEALNPPGPGKKETPRFGVTFRVGDKVIQTRNNYQREVFNGDVGFVAKIETVDQVVTVTFDGKPVEYDFSDLDELGLAYCVSIHKSQGSEYPAVVIPVHTQHFVMLQRNLLYTGITRGRKLVVLVGSRKAVWIAVNRAETKHRFSLLRERLQVPSRPSAC